MASFDSREGRALGSRLRLTVAAGTSPDRLDAAWAAAEAIFDEVDRAMSRFRDDSEVTLLNRRLARRAGAAALTAPAWIPSRSLAAALVVADRARRMTGGRFDARVVEELDRLGAAGVSQGTSLESPANRIRRGSQPLVARNGRGPLALLAPADLGGLGTGLALRWARRA
ncbi:MAG TPA: FAD:protein FMN transferase, partial [Candidatus Limnocylindrales bacterium]|nr:FAD:protein FMN transferase [Candidatus Limnocylindrales bacterium]